MKKKIKEYIHINYVQTVLDIMINFGFNQTVVMKTMAYPVDSHGATKPKELKTSWNVCAQSISAITAQNADVCSIWC